MSNITFSMMNQQLNDMRQKEDAFKNDMKNEQRVYQEQEQLKKTEQEPTDKTTGHAKSSTPAQNAMMLYVQALSQFMQMNQNTMGADVAQMQASNPLMEGIDQQLNQVSQEQSTLAGQSPQDALTHGVEINAKMAQLEQSLAQLGINANEGGANIAYVTSQNNASGGQADQVLDLLAKINRMGH
jgi:hypothetical protein